MYIANKSFTDAQYLQYLLLSPPQSGPWLGCAGVTRPAQTSVPMVAISNSPQGEISLSYTIPKAAPPKHQPRHVLTT